MLSREQINSYYQSALEYFTKNYPQFLCTIEQNVFVVQLNYSNDKYFSGEGMSTSAKTYRCVVRILPNGKFYMTDVYIENETAIGLGGFRITMSSFAGKSINYHYEAVLDKDDNTGEISFKKYKFSTLDIQRPVKKYFSDLGLKYKFYSYALDLQAQPKIMRIVIIIVPLICGIIITSLALLIKEFRLGLIGGIPCLLWGIINLVCLLKKYD